MERARARERDGEIKEGRGRKVRKRGTEKRNIQVKAKVVLNCVT